MTTRAAFYRRPLWGGLLSAAALTLLLSGCGGSVRDTLGLGSRAPDEYRVVALPPLSLPPGFDQLPQPGEGGNLPGMVGSGVMSADPLAAPVGAVQATTARTPGEAALLNRAVAGEVDPEIRRKLEGETLVVEQKKEEESSGWFGWVRDFTRESDATVDPVEEAGRLRQDGVPTRAPILRQPGKATAPSDAAPASTTDASNADNDA